LYFFLISLVEHRITWGSSIIGYCLNFLKNPKSKLLILILLRKTYYSTLFYLLITVRFTSVKLGCTSSLQLIDIKKYSALTGGNWQTSPTNISLT
jgi:hypothetical protein